MENKYEVLDSVEKIITHLLDSADYEYKIEYHEVYKPHIITYHLESYEIQLSYDHSHGRVELFVMIDDVGLFFLNNMYTIDNIIIKQVILKLLEVLKINNIADRIHNKHWLYFNKKDDAILNDLMKWEPEELKLYLRLL